MPREDFGKIRFSHFPSYPINALPLNDNALALPEALPLPADSAKESSNCSWWIREWRLETCCPMLFRASAWASIAAMRSWEGRRSKA